MRGVVSAGAALALEHLKTNDLFDSYWGVSAGAITACYFSSRQAAFGTSIFYEDLIGKDFFSWKRLIQRKAPMDLDFLLDEIVEKKKPLDFSRVFEKDLHVFATNTDTGDLDHFSGFREKEDLKTALKASSALPFVTGNGVFYNNQSYIDGGIHTAVPFREALEADNSHILVILSRPEGSLRPAIGSIEHFLARNIAARKYPQLVPVYLKKSDSYNQAISEVEALEDSGENVLVISPPRFQRPVFGFEMDQEKLMAGVKDGAGAVYREFFGQAPDFRPLFTPTDFSGSIIS